MRIDSTILHNAVGILVKAGDRKREIKVERVTDKQVLRWKNIDYIVIDKVSMMDTKVMIQLNRTLNLLRGSNQEHDVRPYGGVNILFSAISFNCLRCLSLTYGGASWEGSNSATIYGGL